MIICVDIFIELGAETVNIIINLRIEKYPREVGAGRKALAPHLLGCSKEKNVYLVQIIIDQWWTKFLGMIMIDF